MRPHCQAPLDESVDGSTTTGLRPDQIGNALERAMFTAGSNQIQTKVGLVRFPTHQHHARATATGRSAVLLTSNIHGCCHTLVEEVHRAVR